MKKTLLSLILALVLCMTSSLALATGLSGLSTGGGLAGLSEDFVAPTSGLPDPSEVLDDQYATLMRENYAFSSDYLCTAYTYPHPVSVANFIDKYSALAKKCGYTVAESLIEGMKAYTVTGSDGLYAILVPYFENKLLFLVQNGMDFTAAERRNYMTMTFNGIECDLRVFSAEIDGLCYDMMMENPEREPFRFFNLYIPANAKAGSEYYIHDEVYIEDFNVLYDNDEWLIEDFAGYYGRGDAIETGMDFFHLSVTDMQIIEEGTLLKGTFSARLKDGDMTIENGEFCVICERYL